MESEFREFPCWLWDWNSLYWHQNIRIKFSIKFLIKFRTFWCQFHILCANESSKNCKNKTSGTIMEGFGNASHDEIQKLMDKSKNKNTTKVAVTAFLLFPQSVIPYILVAMWQTSCRTCTRAIWNIFLVSHIFAFYFPSPLRLVK